MNSFELRDNAKLLIKYFLRFVLKVFWLFPIKHNRVLFMANMGKGYLCSPKYIYESMLADTRFDKSEFIWCFKDIKAITYANFSERTKLVQKSNIFLYFYYLLTTEIVIYNCGGFSYAPIRKKQFLIETWHGGGAFKKVGLAVDNKSTSSKIGIQLAMDDVKLFLASCEIGTETFIREAMGYSGKVLNSGLPRNDLFFCENDPLIKKIKEELNILDSKVILYAPTFRGDESSGKGFETKTEIIDPQLIKSSFSERYGGDWRFFTRGHQYSNSVEIDGVDGDLSKYPDMQELLLIADVLITDYSSSIWDFALTRKQCYLFVPDLDNYMTNDRGFLTPIESWPGIIVKSNNELVQAIKQYNASNYQQKIDDYIKLCNGYENGNACALVKQEILALNKNV